MEIHQVLISTPALHQCTKVHISHPAILIKMKSLHFLHGLIQSLEHHNLSTPTIYHHLRIMMLSPLIPYDRSLYITINNIIYALTPMDTVTVVIPHRIYLFLNPHNHISYLQHTHEVDECTTRHLEITTTLPSTHYPSTWPRRRPMIRAIKHTPNLVTTLTRPADSLQYQLSIMTLATHLLISVPNITLRQSLDIVREVESHQNTLKLTLTTIILKQYYKVWCTILDTR